jgi:hypothetical protein
MNIRKDLELYVSAWNVYLKETVKTMDIITLLRNAHPTYRPAFASKLLEEKMISKDEAREFVKIIGE